jgi:DNA-directed RNA polymerase subunit K/omega
MNDSDVEDQAEEGQVAEEPLEPIQIQLIVPEDERITTNMMTKFEFTNLVGTRAQ